MPRPRLKRKMNLRRKLSFEILEQRNPLAFSVTGANFFSNLYKVEINFNHPINASSVGIADLVIDSSGPAIGFDILASNRVAFYLPTLSNGSHTIDIAASAILDSSSVGNEVFSQLFLVDDELQYQVKHNPRLQPGDAPLVGYAGSELDRVDVLWQTIPAGPGVNESFVVDYRPASGTTWQLATLNSTIDTAFEDRLVWSASITSLNWNSDYVYRVRHLHGDFIGQEYTSGFHTRLAAGDASSFSFATYGDSADGAALGFRSVQARINQVNPRFTVLLGDNVYYSGAHDESDSRFDPLVNPEAATWMASHIDYLGLGNHDVGTSDGLPSQQNFSVPIPVAGVTAPAAPPASEAPEHSFSWDYGSVHFVTFDTNSLSDAQRLDGLLKWVVADLSASTARWKIVYGHHPLAGVPDKPEHPGENYYQQAVNRLKAAGVDLFMTGHSHTYAWTYPLTGQINGSATYADHGSTNYFLAGEGLPQLVSGLGGHSIRPGDFSQFPFIAKGFSSDTEVEARLGFSKVDVTPNVLTISYVAANDGSVIDAFTITKEVTQSVAFQQGVNGYSGTADTMLVENNPTLAYSTAASLKVDSEDASGKAVQVLLRFDNLFGVGSGKIPLNSTIRSATLELQVTNGSVNNMNLHRLLNTWSGTDTWDSRVDGIQADGIESTESPDTSSGTSQIGKISFNVLSSLQAWKTNPATNFGWAIVPTGADGVDFNSSEATIKPRLVVSFVPPPPTTLNNAYLFYNDSEFETNGGVAGAIDNVGKQLLKSSGTSLTTSVANVSNYTLGINGLVFDVNNLATTTLTASDFVFRMRQNTVFETANPSTWANAPAQTLINIVPGSPSRIRLEWSNNSIKNTWLQIILKANAKTGLTAPLVFYIGHAAGDAAGSAPYRVGVGDLSAIQSAISSAIRSITEARDVDKNRRIGVGDLSFVQSHVASTVLLQNIMIPIAGSAAEGAPPPGPGFGSLLLANEGNGNGSMLAAPPVAVDLTVAKQFSVSVKLTLVNGNVLQTGLQLQPPSSTSTTISDLFARNLASSDSDDNSVQSSVRSIDDFFANFNKKKLASPERISQLASSSCGETN